MKNQVLILLCALLVGCSHFVKGNDRSRSIAKAGQREQMQVHSDPVRWAVVNCRALERDIERWAEEQIQKTNQTEVLTPQEVQKLKEFEDLSNQLGAMAASSIDPTTGLPTPPRIDENRRKDYEALLARVNEARAPIRHILDRRYRIAEEIRHRITTGQIVGEYVKDRFDLVVDSGDSDSSCSAIVYQRNGEVLDITQGVLKYFEEKYKQ